MPKRITIKDVANQVGFSVTTVAKAINNQDRINSETRQKILDAVRQMGYTPNRSARAMASKEMVLAAIYPDFIDEFVSYIEDGFRQAAKELADYRVEIKLIKYGKLNAANQINDYLLQLASDQDPINGLVLISSLHEEIYIDQLNHMADLNIPFLYLVSEGDSSKALGTIRLNTEVAGAMAAQFIQMTMPKGKQAAILVGNKDLKVHSHCIDGFLQQAQQLKMQICGVYETNDDKEIAYYLTNRLFHEFPDLGGIYVSSYNSVGVCQWFEDHDLQGSVIIIGHDLYPALADKMEAGTLIATLFQNQYEFGRRSLHILYEYLAGFRQKSECTKLMTPQLVMKSNLSCYKTSY